MNNKICACNERVINSAEFETKCPTAKKNLGNAIRLYNIMIEIADEACASSMEEMGIQFGAAFKRLVRIYNEKYYINSNLITISHYLFALVRHGIVEKIADEDINEDLYEKMKRFFGKKDRYRTAVYSLPILDDEKLEQIEMAAKEWVELGYKLSSISYNVVLTTEGIEACKKYYPQFVYKNQNKERIRYTTGSFDQLYKRVCKYVADNINLAGYCVESNIHKDLKVDNRQVKKVLPGVMNLLGLQEIRCNNERKESLALSISGYPLLLVPKDIYLGTEEKK